MIVVNLCFTSLFGTKGLLSDIVNHGSLVTLKPLLVTIIVVNPFLIRLNRSYCELTVCSNNKICKRLVPNYYYHYFSPLEYVGRGSETQVQVGENLNHLI